MLKTNICNTYDNIYSDSIDSERKIEVLHDGLLQKYSAFGVLKEFNIRK